MSRKKMKLAYITNDSKRKTTYKKRTKGLVKKVHELTTLCGIEACAIIHSPDFDSQQEEWPSHAGVRRLLSEFKKLPQSKQNNKMVNQESFLEQSIAKATQQLRKLRKENRQKELKKVMFQSLSGKGIFQSLNAMDLNEVGLLIKQNLKDIDDGVHVLTKASYS
ncbi:agamous-like MADS-box protein AGL80 [Gossypium australe]|uniref:Agamous-like MADS-box protein AGL80 n=1 Tax=Gossypium australe TaxID=47621 RepID=A0A5B6WZQ8_9ROSI|nr:agamous-like MADS-box protein AGL80 [Gossypium australe]